MRHQLVAGLCHTGDHLITIRCGQTPIERFKTFVHEVLHAICYEYRIAHTEGDIERLEDPIVNFLLDNNLVM